MHAGSPSLLWQIETAAEDPTGFHCGADVSMLSQFSHEAEVLFPPLTMLTVKRRQGEAPSGMPESERPWAVEYDEHDGKKFKRVSVARAADVRARAVAAQSDRVRQAQGGIRSEFLY